MAEVVEIRHRPQGAVLAQYGKSTAPVHIIRGPLGGGKTYESIYKMLDLCINQRANKEGVRKSRGAVIRNTYPDLISTVIKDVQEVVPETIGHLTMGHPPELELDFDLEDGTRVSANIMFLALDKPEDQRKIRGLNVTWIYVNELKELERAVFDMLTTRADRYPQIGWSSWAGVFGDTNSWDQDHWLEELAQKAAKKELVGYEFFVQPGAVLKINGKWEVNPLAENPAAVTTGYYAKAVQGKREEWIRVNLANEIGYSFDGKPVHPEYSDTTHVSPTPLVPSPGIAYVGLDFGLTPAAVMWQRQANGQWWGFDELVATDMHNADFAIELKAAAARWRLRVPGLTFFYIGDPSGDSRSGTDGKTTFQIYRQAGITGIRPASTNDPQIRRDALHRPLSRYAPNSVLPGLVLSPHMHMLRKALSGAWCYRRVRVAGKTETYKDEADKNAFSHVGEAAEYGLMDAGEHAIVNSAANAGWGANEGRGVSAIAVPQKTWDPFAI